MRLGTGLALTVREDWAASIFKLHRFNNQSSRPWAGRNLQKLLMANVNPNRICFSFARTGLAWGIAVGGILPFSAAAGTLHARSSYESPLKGQTHCLAVVNTLLKSQRGVDFATSYGEGIYASAAGVVSFSGIIDNFYGKGVVIDHHNRTRTVYAHLSSISKKLRKGSSVKASVWIGNAGESGMIDGSRLHFEVQRKRLVEVPQGRSGKTLAISKWVAGDTCGVTGLGCGCTVATRQ